MNWVDGDWVDDDDDEHYEISGEGGEYRDAALTVYKHILLW